MSAAIDRLFVIWGEPVKGGRHVIGHLERAAGEFRFWYAADLSRAQAHGFRPLPELPELRGAERPYTARYLFALFAERIPSAARSDAAAMLRAWGVEHADDQFEVLAKSGGVRATDRLELAEFRADDDPLDRPLELRIAGRRHLASAAPLAVGDVVTLRREPENPADTDAVIIDRAGNCAGYVPRQYTAMFGRLLATGVTLEGTAVRELLVPDDVGKWVVRVVRHLP